MFPGYENISRSLAATSPQKQQLFFGFSMGSNQYLAGRVYYLCVYFMTGTPEGSTESGFMEKPGIEPATPGLQDIGISPTPRRRLRRETRCLRTGILPRLSDKFSEL